MLSFIDFRNKMNSEIAPIITTELISQARYFIKKAIEIGAISSDDFESSDLSDEGVRETIRNVYEKFQCMLPMKRYERFILKSMFNMENHES